MGRGLWSVAVVGVLCGWGVAAGPGAVSGDAVIRGKAGESEIVIKTTDRLAGAIDSLTWNGKEFIDSHDHGRQLQSADSFDLAKGGEFWPECFNPTEAGSRKDGTGGTSSSRLLKLSASGAELRTTTQMAFWLAPGEESSGRLALNHQVLSDHVVSKCVHIGHGNLSHVVEYTVTFTMPSKERHTLAQFEALTGYMPAEFSRFWKYMAKGDKLEALDAGPGEQECPVVFSTEDGRYAMGVFSPEAKPGYGRFEFKPEKVVKWNCVFRVRSATRVPTGDHRFRVFVAVGTVEDVRQSMKGLAREFGVH